MRKTIFISIAVILALFVAMIALSPKYYLRSHARCCVFDKNVIGSIYSGNCMLPSGTLSKTFVFLGSSYTNRGGSAISDVHIEPIYGIESFQNQKTDTFLLFLVKTIGRDGTQPIFLILDILNVPPLETSQKLMYGQNVCKFKNSFDNEILAIAKDEEVQELANITKAWRANTTKGKFEEISIMGITCQQECVGDECI